MMKLKAKAALHRQAMQRSSHLLKQQPVTSAVTILMLALVLVLTMLFWNLSAGINQLTSNWQHNGHILLYLKVPTDPLDADHLLTQIQTTAGVSEVSLSTPQQGLDMLSERGGIDDALHYLSDNPLPFVMDVVPAANIDNPDRLNQLYQTLKAYPHVEEASLDLAWMKRLFVLLHFLSHVLTGLNILLVVTGIFIIGNTLRLIIRDRADEMTVFKLVGATHAYITRPFLYSGMWYGLLAGICACVVVHGLLFALNQKITQFTLAYSVQYQLPQIAFAQTLGFIISAGVLGWLSACFSTRIILRNIE